MISWLITGIIYFLVGDLLLHQGKRHVALVYFFIASVCITIYGVASR